MRMRNHLTRSLREEHTRQSVAILVPETSCRLVLSFGVLPRDVFTEWSYPWLTSDNGVDLWRVIRVPEVPRGFVAPPY